MRRYIKLGVNLVVCGINTIVLVFLINYAYEKWVKHYHLAGAGIGEYAAILGFFTGLAGVLLCLVFKPTIWKWIFPLHGVLLLMAVALILVLLCE